MRESSAVEWVEEAKKVSESIWVIRHAMQCNCEAEEDAWGHQGSYNSELQRSSSKCRRCEVAGCGTAKRVLRVIEEQEKANLGEDAVPKGSALEAAVGFVRSVLHHQVTCPWALGGPCDADTEPCLLCALVSRARVARTPALSLDYSRRAERDAPSFEVPDIMSRRDLEAALDDCPPELRRSTTTEELAMLLSDLSRRPNGPVAATPILGELEKRRQRPTVYPPAEEDEDAAEQPSMPPTRRHRVVYDNPYADDAKHEVLPEAPTPELKRPRFADPDEGSKPLRVTTTSPRAAVAAHAGVMPRSPSFSAAASSLLALTGSKPRPQRSNIVGQRVPPLLMPQC